MREIKFRGRNAAVPQCWIYGYFVIEEGCCYIINDDGKFKVIAGTQSQYTGLKDTNGKEIYEGDIIKCEVDERIAEVSFENGCFWYEDKKSNYGELHNVLTSNLEVVGNIYENLELLEAKKCGGEKV